MTIITVRALKIMFVWYLKKKSIAGNVEVSLITIANIKVHLLRYSPLHQKINVWAVTTIIKPGSMAADLLLFI